MKKTIYAANILLAVILAVMLLAVVLLKAFIPNLLLRGINIPFMAAVSLLALLAERSMLPEARHKRIPQACLAAITFAALPWAAGMLFSLWEILRYAVAGGLAFAACTTLLDSLAERVEGTAGIFSCAFLIFLASQGFAGILI